MNRKRIPEQIAEERIARAFKSNESLLDLIGLGLRTLPDSLGQLRQLQILQISLNQLTKLPDSLSQLTKLQRLDVSGNQLAALPKWISQLTQLQSLDVGGNQLTALDSISQLAQLQRLSVSRNQLTTLPDSLGQLRQLQRLDVSGNQLAALPKWISQLTQLQSLNVSDNQLTTLPGLLIQLTQLQRLSVSHNQLTTLPELLGQLTQLYHLDASYNQLTALPESIRLLSSLKRLFLHGNPGLGLPTEILGPDPTRYAIHMVNYAKPSSILDYYFHIARPLNEGKLILVGSGDVGKTCIVNRLVNNSFNLNETKTEGINITNWKIHLGCDDIRLNIWDFGGQEIMHATHQFFLTGRSLYLLVLNGREGIEDYVAEYWVKLISSFATDSLIIVVQNKIDQHPFELNYRGLQSKYPQIRYFVKTDCKTPKGIEELYSRIQEVLSNLPALKVNFPSAWFAIKDRLADMRENYLRYEEFRDLCLSYGEQDTKEQDKLAGFLHDLGIALNYKDDLRLRETSVLNPRWVTEGIYKLLNAGKLAEHKGVMDLQDLEEWLSTSKEYPGERRLFLLELMRKFRLCFAFPDDRLNRYLVPELLDKEEPDLGNEFDPKTCLNFEYHYDIVPEGLLPQFIVRNYVRIVNNLRWRYGVVLQWEGCCVLVKADIPDRHVVVRVRGATAGGRRRLLAVVRSDFEYIHSNIFKIEVKARVPLPKYPKITIDYEDLILFERNGVQEYPVRSDDHLIWVNVTDLLSGIDLNDSIRRKRQIKKAQTEFQLFFSYSHNDESLRDELGTHLKLLEYEGKIRTWYDRIIQPGEDWKDKIDEKLELANIILLLVSADFISSQYCWDVEMKRAMERHEHGEACVIPVIIRDCDWHAAPFGTLDALPKNGLPITQWPDRDKAWTQVTQEIRRVLELC